MFEMAPVFGYPERAMLIQWVVASIRDDLDRSCDIVQTAIVGIAANAAILMQTG